jgi:hypothetical protein
MSPSFKGWDENLLDIGGETLAVDGAVDHERRVDPIAAEGCDWVKTNMTPLRGWGPKGRRLVAKPRMATGKR